MTNAIKWLVSLYFGILVFVLVGFVAFELIEIRSGPEFGPGVFLIALLLGLSTILAMSYQANRILSAFGINECLQKTARGRTFITAVFSFIVAIVVLYFYNDEFIPVAYLVPIFAILVRIIMNWIKGGEKFAWRRVD